MNASPLLVLLPRIAAGAMALVLVRDAWGLVRGRRALVHVRGLPRLYGRWSSLGWGAVLLGGAVAFGRFALFWRGPSQPP